MASAWWNFGRNASSTSNLNATNYLQFSKTNIEEIAFLTSLESQREPLNSFQCRSMSQKLVKIIENIKVLHNASILLDPNLTTKAFENLFQVSQRAREIVEDCCSSNWCLASTFQIHNEEAFKEILLDTSLCYNVIIDIAKAINKDHVSIEDLRFTSIFDPPTSKEVLQDQMALIKRYKDFVDVASISSPAFIRKQHLAKYLLKRLDCIPSKSNMSSEDFDVCNLKLWQDGKSPDDEWGKQSEFLGGCVCKTTWLDVPCAQKMIEDCTPEDGILVEARILASLNHPNIVKFICCGHDNKNSRHFIAMEQMEAGLHSVIKQRARLRNGSPFILLSAIDIILQIASGTCYLHENGIAHRDLKTCNVVVHQIITPHLQEYLQVKLVDFGLSKVNLKASNSNTISYPKRGTTHYMPPEAFHHGRANWFKADAYSFGIMCSVILSGEEPFEKIRRNKVYEAICNGERPKLPVNIPQDLASLIKKCWDTNRHSRPKFVEICTRLARIKHNLLKEDSFGQSFKHDVDDSSSFYIEEKMKRRSNARKYDYLQGVTSERVNHISKSMQGIDEATTSEAQHLDEVTSKLQYYQTNTMQQLLQVPSSIQPISWPTSIFWDMENCPVPWGMNSEDVVNNIRIALREHSHVGKVVMFSAYGNFNHFPKKVREGCQRSGINLIDISNGNMMSNDIVHKAIWVDMALFALDNRPPSTIFLITGDVDFAPALHKLGQRGYVVVLVIPDGVRIFSALRGAGRFVYEWKCLCSGGGLQNPQRQLRFFNGLYQIPS